MQLNCCHTVRVCLDGDWLFQCSMTSWQLPIMRHHVVVIACLNPAQHRCAVQGCKYQTRMILCHSHDASLMFDGGLLAEDGVYKNPAWICVLEEVRARCAPAPAHPMLRWVAWRLDRSLDLLGTHTIQDTAHPAPSQKMPETASNQSADVAHQVCTSSLA